MVYISPTAAFRSMILSCEGVLPDGEGCRLSAELDSIKSRKINGLDCVGVTVGIEGVPSKPRMFHPTEEIFNASSALAVHWCK